MILYHLFGALAQLVAHNTGSVGVRSSNLLCSTSLEAVKLSLPDFFLIEFSRFDSYFQCGKSELQKRKNPGWPACRHESGICGRVTLTKKPNGIRYCSKEIDSNAFYH